MRLAASYRLGATFSGDFGAIFEETDDLFGSLLFCLGIVTRT